MRNTLIAAATAVGLVAAVPAIAHHAGEMSQAGDIRVSHAWTEETSAMAHAVEVYLTVENTGAAADRLIGATTGFTEPGVFQAAVIGADGAAEVREVPAVTIEPGQSITFQPGGIHIVLNDVQQALMAGDHFDMTLEFETAGTLAVEVEIEEPHDHDHDHDHEDAAG